MKHLCTFAVICSIFSILFRGCCTEDVAKRAIAVSEKYYNDSGESKEPLQEHFNVASVTAEDSLLYVEIPVGTPSQKKQYEGFMVDFNAANHTANYVSWKLLASKTDGSAKRTGEFLHDEDVKGCPYSEDYKHSGFDRGHMCPAADQKWSRTAMAHSFVMTNICPQAGALNSGAWSTLEKKERQWACNYGKLIIIAGPVYEARDTARIGHTGVRIPSSFFKVVYAPTVSRAIAFVYPNRRSPGNMANYSMTVDRLEEITGYDFFHTMPENEQHKIESKASFSSWDR